MKYKHEFAICHLPQYIFGLVLILAGSGCFSGIIYQLLTSGPNGYTVVLTVITVFGWAVGGLIISEGIEYTKTKNDAFTRHYESKRPKYDPWKEKEARREEVLNYDFTPSPTEIEAAKKQEIKNKLKDDVFLDR